MDAYLYYSFTDPVGPYMCNTPFTPNVVTFIHGILVCGFGM